MLFVPLESPGGEAQVYVSPLCDVAAFKNNSTHNEASSVANFPGTKEKPRVAGFAPGAFIQQALRKRQEPRQAVAENGICEEDYLFNCG